MENVQKKPEIIVFAGPNGSGKSTFTEILRPSQMDYINADEIKKSEFCFETVLSTSRNLELLKRAREMGYFIRCYYILTIDPTINVYRVKARVASGGHDVPVEKIYARYDRAIDLVPKVVAVSDICHIYDNSEEEPFRIFKKRKNVCFYDECDDWRREKIETLTGIVDMERKDLNQHG